MMKVTSKISGLLVGLGALLAAICSHAQEEVVPQFRKTSVSIVEDEFWINGGPTYNGRQWNGHKIQGLLFNSRMVQGIFDDKNPETVSRWTYPDTKKWDPERNTREFIEAMPEWKKHGLLAFTLNLQGGSPEGYSKDQPWHNSAFESDGSLDTNYMNRLEKILEKADETGMAVILGLFYFGQDQRLADEAAVIRAVDNTLKWLFDRNYRNVLIEVNNECDVKYDHAILKPDRVHELINRIRDTTRSHRRFYVGASYGGGKVPDPNVLRVSDFVLLHGNGVSNPAKISEMVRAVRKAPGYLFSKPILFNEDDHFDFTNPTNNFVAAVSEYASWGYFDPGTNNYADGYQSPPVNWGMNTERKRDFFTLLAEIADYTRVAPLPPPPVATDVRVVNVDYVTTSMCTYRGWSNSYMLNNGVVEATVVPAVGRIMQFGFVGEEGVFWENKELFGKAAQWEKGWANFGGDKAWPSPDKDWTNFTKRSEWCPPPAFDGLPATATMEGGDLVLTSPVDPYYSIRVKRRIHLERKQPAMIVTTTFDRLAGDPAPMGIWVVTQLKDPTRIYVPVTAATTPGEPFVSLLKASPPDLKSENGLISLSRNPKAAHKIGTQSGTLLWVGEKCVLRIDSPRVPNVLYPDQKSSAEVYTSRDPLKYVELETLGPLYMLKPGERIERINTYTLTRRIEKTPDEEARKILGH